MQPKGRVGQEKKNPKFRKYFFKGIISRLSQISNLKWVEMDDSRRKLDEIDENGYLVIKKISSPNFFLVKK